MKSAGPEMPWNITTSGIAHTASSKARDEISVWWSMPTITKASTPKPSARRFRPAW
ncbi:hypothetical protein D3C72_2226530 [compost metagenome]